MSKPKPGKTKPSETAPSGSSKTSTDQQEEFAPNAEGDEGSDDEGNAMDLIESEPPQPQNFHLQIYEQARPFLGMLMENPRDEGARSELQKLNRQIFDQNLNDGLPKKDLENFCIQIDTFIANFSLAKDPHEVLIKNPANKKARETLNKINEMLTQLNKRHGYPKNWTIQVPPEPKVNGTESTESKPAKKTNKSSTKGGVTTKIEVTIPNESDGRTFLGKVTYVKKAGYGLRVIVNRGTDEHPYFEIHPGATFGKGVAKEWLKERTYQSEDLPKKTTSKQMQIYGRVTVEKTAERRFTKTLRTNSPIQYYMIKVGTDDYVSTKSALLEKRGMSPAKLQRINASLDRQSKKLLAKLDRYRKNEKHPDTGEPLTSTDIEEMPWLSSDAILEDDSDSEDEYDEDSDEEDSDEEDPDEEDSDEDDSIRNIVPHRAGLKRISKRKAASVSSEPSEDSENSTDSDSEI